MDEVAVTFDITAYNFFFLDISCINKGGGSGEAYMS